MQSIFVDSFGSLLDLLHKLLALSFGYDGTYWCLSAGLEFLLILYLFVEHGSILLEGQLLIVVYGCPYLLL